MKARTMLLIAFSLVVVVCSHVSAAVTQPSSQPAIPSVTPAGPAPAGELVPDPYLGASDVSTSGPQNVCMPCIPGTYSCQNPHKDSGHVCGATLSCTCRICNGAYGCF